MLQRRKRRHERLHIKRFIEDEDETRRDRMGQDEERRLGKREDTDPEIKQARDTV